MELTKRKLGSQGLEVSAVGLGCMGMSQYYGPADEKESIATLHHGLEIGCNFYDTAESYGPFVNEKLLGKAFKSRREQVIIATKFGCRFLGNTLIGWNSHPKHIKKAVEGCLRRLNTDYIDLLYQHRIDPGVPIEEVAGAVSELVKEGKVKYFGLSEAGIANIRKAHAIHPVTALQSEYSLWERNLEPDIIPVLRELGIGLVPYCPLGKGFLSGNVKRAEEYPKGDARRSDQRFKGRNYDINKQAADVVFKIAAEKGAKPSQIALAWLLHKGDDIVPIPGTKHRAYLEDNMGAISIGLDSEEMKLLDEAMEPGKIAGKRQSALAMTAIDRKV